MYICIYRYICMCVYMLLICLLIHIDVCKYIYVYISKNNSQDHFCSKCEASGTIAELGIWGQNVGSYRNPKAMLASRARELKLQNLVLRRAEASWHQRPTLGSQ